MNHAIWTYAVYAGASIGLTAVLARTLFRNGAVFLTEVFEDKPEMAHAINQLLVVGFYMLNLGYAFLIFETNGAATAVEATEVLVTKLGLLLVSLGIIHFVNMSVFWRIKRSGGTARPAPTPPSTFVPPPSPSTFVPPPPTGPATPAAF